MVPSVKTAALPSFAYRPKASALGIAGGGLNAISMFLMPVTLLGMLAGAIGGSKLPNGAIKAASLKASDVLSSPMKPFGEMKKTQDLCKFANKSLHCDISSLTIANTVSLGVSAFSTVSLVKGFADKAKVMAHMYEGITGQKISPWAVIMKRDLPQPLKKIRGQAFGKGGIAALLELGLTGFNIAGIVGKQPAFMKQGPLSNPWVQTAGMSMLYQIPGAITSSQYDAISGYQAAYQCIAAGSPIPEEVYEHMIAGSIPNMSVKYGATLKSALTEQQTPPGEVMKILHEMSSRPKEQQPVAGRFSAQEAARRAAGSQQLSYVPT